MCDDDQVQGLLLLTSLDVFLYSVLYSVCVCVLLSHEASLDNCVGELTRLLSSIRCGKTMYFSGDFAEIMYFSAIHQTSPLSLWSAEACHLPQEITCANLHHLTSWLSVSWDTHQLMSQLCARKKKDLFTKTLRRSTVERLTTAVRLKPSCCSVSHRGIFRTYNDMQ